LLGLGWPLSMVFVAAAIPAFVAGLAILLKGFVLRNAEPTAVPQAA